jgi:hypothetical protein
MTHTLVSFQFGDQNVQIPQVAGGSQLKGISEENLSKMVALDYQLTPLMPFNGGVVEIVAALVAMKGKDYIASVVKVMGDLSKLLVVPQLSTALGYALPIASGVQDLLGGGSGTMRTGVHKSFVGEGGGTGANVMYPGYFAVIDGSASDFPEAEFWIRGGRLYHGDDMTSSVPFEKASHLLFQLETRDERDDWMSFKEIEGAYQDAIRQLGDQEAEKAEAAIRRAIVLARTSPDLTRADRNRVALALRDEFGQAKAGGFGAVPSAQRNLKDLVFRRGGNVDDALENESSLKTLLE